MGSGSSESRGGADLSKDHVLKLLGLVERSKFKLFILEKNGIPLGIDSDYAEEISKFKKVHVKVSLKAGTPEAFVRKTGASPKDSICRLRL